MEIRTKFFEKHLHDIALDQLAEDYSTKGYQVSKEKTVGNYQADLVAENGNETLVIEVESGKMTKEKKDRIARLGNYVRGKSGYKFLVAFATPPKNKTLAIPNLENLLFEKLNFPLPDEIEQLPYTHKRIDNVREIDISEIQVEENYIYVKGDGILSVELQSGSNGDVEKEDGYKYIDSFTFIFEVALEYNNRKELQITDVKDIEVDTSSYYE